MALALETFAVDGFVRMDGFLSGGELLEARESVDAVLAAPLPEGCVRPHNTLAPCSWNTRIVRDVLTCDRKLRRIAEAIDAVDLKWISAYASVKEPRSGALWWHQDWWCWDHAVTYRVQATQVAVLCYLGETGMDAGALRLLRGSHRKSHPLHEILPEAHSGPESELTADHPAMRDVEEQMTFVAAPGDAIAIDYRLLHGTHPNVSDARRTCLILNFVPAWRSLPDDVRAHLIQHPALPGDGDAVPDDLRRVLPRYTGVRRDLALSRDAPAQFEIR